MPRGRQEGDQIGPYGLPGKDSGLRSQRIAAGLTQADLAILAGVSERTVRTHEDPQYYPTSWKSKSLRSKLFSHCSKPAKNTR